MKKLLAILLATLLLLSLVACGKDPEEPAETEAGTESSAPADTAKPTPTPDDESKDDDEQAPPDDEGDDDEIETVTVDLNKNTKGIKLLGVRSVLSDSQINCDHSGSGIEFVLRNTSLSLAIEANSSAPCRFKAYVNGALFESPMGDEYYEINGKSVITMSGLPLGNITVRLVKITDQALAMAELTKMTFSGILSSSTPEAEDLYIEFVGGAEAVGTGLAEGEGYAAQDVTKAYSYLLAEKLDADYAITSVSAATALTDVAALYAKASPVRDAEAEYGFARKADVVVVDLGAVDAALSATDDTVTPEAFAERYEALLTAIRAKNGEDCKIVCVYTSAMGDFGTAVLNACRVEMGGQQEGFYSCQMAMGEDKALDAVEREAFLTLLETVTETALEGTITERELETGENGDGLKVDFKEDFVPVG
ncbi:MAG: hypothetical protein E7668_04460 [Ruminococcaceae bacterium]|nr:hypothetical protein [Oscillospiraceae bacterium]